MIRALFSLLLFCPGVAALGAALGASLEPFVNSECRFGGEFQQRKTIPGLPHVLESGGRYLFDCEAGIIWRTARPIRETLVFTFDGRHYQVADDGAVTSKEGRVQAFIGELMLTMISGAEQRLRREFELAATGERTLVLVPKTRHLRRALDHVKLRRLADARDGLPAGVAVDIVDRNQQIVAVIAEVDRVYRSAQAFASHCATAVGNHGATVCRLLAGPPADDVPAP